MNSLATQVVLLRSSTQDSWNDGTEMPLSLASIFIWGNTQLSFNSTWVQVISQQHGVVS
jgi:hypothetical protein